MLRGMTKRTKEIKVETRTNDIRSHNPQPTMQAVYSQLTPITVQHCRGDLRPLVIRCRESYVTRIGVGCLQKETVFFAMKIIPARLTSSLPTETSHNATTAVTE